MKRNKDLASTIPDPDPVAAFMNAAKRAQVAKDCAFAIARNSKGFAQKEQEGRIVRAAVMAYKAGVAVGRAKERLAQRSNDPKAAYLDWRPGRADLVQHDA